ncbi:MAG: ABC transporter permease [Bacteroidota bacterium]
MFRNNLLVAFRAFRRQKGYTIINMLGLAVGLASSFFILLWVSHAGQFDRFHENGDHLYRATRHVGPDTWVSMSKPLVDVLEADYPAVEHALLLPWGSSPLVAGGFLFVITLATVSSQALRAATADPVRALRSE